jgi:hypothetical protein
MKDASLTFGEISPVSTFIETTVWSRVEAVKRSKEDAVGTPVGSSAVEFDDVRLHVNSVNGSSALEVSIGAPSGAFDAKSAREDAQKLLDGELVKVNERANSGYDLTASVDVDALAYDRGRSETRRGGATDCEVEMRRIRVQAAQTPAGAGGDGRRGGTFGLDDAPTERDDVHQASE